MAKPKFEPCMITSRAAMSAAVNDILQTKLDITQMDAELEQKKLELEPSYSARKLILEKHVEIREAGVRIWCDMNPDEFSDKKSIDLGFALVGYRTTPKSVKPIRANESDKSLARRLESLEWGERYLTWPDPKINKDALKTDEGLLTPVQLRQAGIKFDQSEEWYIKPQTQLVEATKQAA
jgi:phage host-nuclease inhibitor protein Gam